MLTLKQINEITFTKTSFRGGYKGEEVDDFIDEVIETFKFLEVLIKENKIIKSKLAETEGLVQKNEELTEKLTVLSKKIDSYQGDDDVIKEALMSATKVGAEALKNANIDAKKIVKKAKNDAEVLISDAQFKSTSILKEYEQKIKLAEKEYAVLIDLKEKELKDKISAKEKEFDMLKSTVSDFRTTLFAMYRSHIEGIENIPDYSEEVAKKAKIEKQIALENQMKIEAEKLEQIEEVKVQEEIKSQVVEQIPEINAFEDITEVQLTDPNAEELYEDFGKLGEKFIEDFDDTDVNEKTFSEIDFNAYSSIPEALKSEKNNSYDTLEFGEGIDIKRK